LKNIVITHKQPAKNRRKIKRRTDCGGMNHKEDDPVRPYFVCVLFFSGYMVQTE